jgi:hypothetical protein
MRPQTHTQTSPTAIPLHILTHMCVCDHTFANVSFMYSGMLIRIHVCTHTRIYICTCALMYTYASIVMNMYVCIYLYMHV